MEGKSGGSSWHEGGRRVEPGIEASGRKGVGANCDSVLLFHANILPPLIQPPPLAKIPRFTLTPPFLTLPLRSARPLHSAILAGKQDARYMTPLVREIEKEEDERAFYDTAEVSRK